MPFPEICKVARSLTGVGLFNLSFYCRLARFISPPCAYALMWMCDRYDSPIVEQTGWRYAERPYYRRPKARKCQSYDDAPPSDIQYCS